MRRKINRWLQLVADCLVDLSRNNVKTVFSHTMPYLKDENIYTRGYWDDTDVKNPTLACIITNNEEEWVSIFAHEYCHFCQWREEIPIWKESRSIKADTSNKILSNKPISLKELNYTLNVMRDIELDCEKRTVKLFKEYKVPINIKSYIKKANAYILFYNHIKTYRQWYPKNSSPYQTEQLLQLCSSRFYKSYDTIPPKLLNMFESLYPSKKKNNVILDE